MYGIAKHRSNCKRCFEAIVRMIAYKYFVLFSLIVLLLLKITTVSVRLLVDTAIMDDVMMLIGVDFILLGAMLLLFPGLWRS